METGDYKVVIFDADAYIKMAKNINIKRILLKEKRKNFKGFISLWQLAELLSGGDKHTLQTVNKHCFDDELKQWRFWADPVSMVYHILYKEDMPSTEEIKKEIEYLFDKALNSGLTEQEKIHIKSKLEEVGEDFVRECKNFIGSINSLSPAEIATRVISQVIKKAKDERRDQAPIKNEEIGLMKRELPGAGAYYEFLMKSKLPNSRNLNEEKLLHDQRDWNLFFYAGKDNIYIVTQETKIRKLGLKNVISMEEYLSKELSLSAYLSIRKIIAKIFFWK